MTVSHPVERPSLGLQQMKTTIKLTLIVWAEKEIGTVPKYIELTGVRDAFF